MAIPGWLEFDAPITLLHIEGGLAWLGKGDSLLIVNLALGRIREAMPLTAPSVRAISAGPTLAVQTEAGVDFITGRRRHKVPDAILLDAQDGVGLLLVGSTTVIWDIENAKERCSWFTSGSRARDSRLEDGVIHLLQRSLYERRDLDGSPLSDHYRNHRVGFVRTEDGTFTIRHIQHPTLGAVSTVRGPGGQGKFKGWVTDFVRSGGRGAAVLQDGEDRSLRIWTAGKMHSRFRLEPGSNPKLAADSHTAIALWPNAAVWCAGDEAVVHALEGPWGDGDRVGLWDGFPLISHQNTLVPLWSGKVEEWVVDKGRTPGPPVELTAIELPDDLDGDAI